MVLFSVIIPHYNSVKYLEKLIASIPVDETIQVIVVDDKSTQDTKAVEQFVQTRGGLFIHNTTDKKGAGVCRNLGLKEAKGKWLLFADADDYYVEGAFEQVKNYIDCEADIIYFSPISRYRDTEIEADRHIDYENLVADYLKNPSRENEISIRYKFIVPYSKMVRNEVIQRNEVFFDEVPASNDVMFSIKSAYHAKKIDVGQGQIYCITRAEGTLTTKHDEINFWSRVNVYIERCVFLKEHLQEEDLEVFGFSTFSGLIMVIRALKQGYGMKMAAKICRYLKENGIKLIDWRSLKVSIGRKLVFKK